MHIPKQLNMNKTHIAMILFMLCSQGIFSQSDTLVFNSYNKVVGEIKKLERGILEVDAQFVDENLKIKWLSIKEIYTQSKFIVNIKDKTYQGRISSISNEKVKVFDVDTNIKVAYKTGKLIFGKSQVLSQLRQKPFKMLILANNCPAELSAQLSYYNSLMNDNLFVHRYHGSSWELGIAMGKPYMISIIGDRKSVG